MIKYLEKNDPTKIIEIDGADDIEKNLPEFIISQIESTNVKESNNASNKTQKVHVQIPDFFDVKALSKRGIDIIIKLGKDPAKPNKESVAPASKEVKRGERHKNCQQKKRTRVKCDCANCSTGNKTQLHKCKVCEKQYKKVSHYRYHMVLHTDKRISCSYCNRLFHRKDMLQRHVRIHLGEKCFECDKCKKTFSRSDHLKNHMKSHLKEDGQKESTMVLPVTPQDVEEKVSEIEHIT